MSENTKIEWADASWNPWIGCQAISPGCDNCYAAAWAKRYGRDFAVRSRTKTWAEPLRWNARHAVFFAQHGRRQRVFCASLADVFDNAVNPAWRAELFELVEKTPDLDWLLLTKRIGNVKRMVPASWLAPGSWPRHVRIGATITNDEEARRDIPKLLDLPCPNFLSLEPLLGHVDLRLQESGSDARGIDWVIAGGESGPNARPTHPAWLRSIRDQCATAGVAFLFKQHGEWAQTDAVPGGDLGGDMRRGTVRIVKPTGENDGHFRRGDVLMRNIGKKQAGRLLDGCTHDEFPRAVR
jgi:protein gp37